jgi:hypothetical protein
MQLLDNSRRAIHRVRYRICPVLKDKEYGALKMKGTSKPSWLP